MRVVRVALWLGGAALCARLLVAASGERHRPAGHRYLSADKAAVHYAVALLAITVGLVLWDRRPESLTGPLLTAASFAAVLTELDPLFHRSALALTFAVVASPLVVALFVHLSSATDRPSLAPRPRLRLGDARLQAGLRAAVPALLRRPLLRGHQDRLQCLSCGTAPLTDVGWRF